MRRCGAGGSDAGGVYGLNFGQSQIPGLILKVHQENRMKQKLALFISVLILSACARPGAVTPTAAPTVTSAPATLGAPAVSAPAFTSIRMINAQDGWGLTDTGVIRTSDG